MKNVIILVLVSISLFFENIQANDLNDGDGLGAGYTCIHKGSDEFGNPIGLPLLYAEVGEFESCPIYTHSDDSYLDENRVRKNLEHEHCLTIKQYGS